MGVLSQLILWRELLGTENHKVADIEMGQQIPGAVANKHQWLLQSQLIVTILRQMFIGYNLFPISVI